MVSQTLSPGDHSVIWELPEYDPLYAVINISEQGVVSCLSVEGGTVGSYVAPSVVVVGTVVTGYLEAVGLVDYEAWLVGRGGPEGLSGNLMAVGAILDGYGNPEFLGFTVTLANVGTTLDHYGG